jgi:hypothetical protein
MARAPRHVDSECASAQSDAAFDLPLAGVKGWALGALQVQGRLRRRRSR